MSERRSGRRDAAGPPEAPRAGGAGRDLDTLAEEILPALVARLRASGLAELEVRQDGWRVRLRRDLRVARRPARNAVSDAPPIDAPYDAGAGLARSPAVGYFSPGAALRVGSSVQAGDALGDIDVLGIAVELTAPTGGLVSAVLVEAGQAVEYGQILAEIEALPEPPADEVAAPDGPHDEDGVASPPLGRAGTAPGTPPPGGSA